MREFQAKKKVRRVLYSKGVIALMLIVFVFLANATWSVFKKERASAANVIQAKREYDKLNERNVTLNSEIKRLSTNEGIEEEIRSKYSVSKPGEHMLVIVDNATTTASTTPEKTSWWKRVRHLVGL